MEKLKYGSQGPEVYWGRNGKIYRPSDALIDAANSAIRLNKPLLVTGEPGCGKTDFAFAVARYFGQVPLQYYVRSDTKAKDLLYTYDVVRRFGDAYLQNAGQDAERYHKLARDPRNYIRLNALGLALSSSVKSQRVLLIDEVDKAPRDLPNDLLRELDQKRFEIYEIEEGLGQEDDGFDPQVLDRGIALQRHMGGTVISPIVILTSNAERPLPDAFLRRCLYFHVTYPNDEHLLQILIDTYDGEVPLNDRVTNSAYSRQHVYYFALAIFRGLRREKRLAKRPSTSELIDWVTLLLEPDAKHDGFKEVPQEAFKPTPSSSDWLPKNKWQFLTEITGALSCLVKSPSDLKVLGIDI